MELLYERPADNRRPYGSYRFDVYSLKAQRRMTLFGKAALCLFIDLESDFEVSASCERPLIIPDTKPARVVDFWALCGGVPTFYLLTKQTEAWQKEKAKLPYTEFYRWVADSKGKLVEVLVDDFEKRRTHFDNWSLVLRHLIAHRGQVSEQLIEQCEQVMPVSWQLRDFEGHFREVDSMLVRAAVFTLLAGGRLVCPTISSLPIGLTTEFRRV
ncbi:MAG: hypothetical protein ACREXG_02165 [Polaromonas sp.]